MTQKYLSLIEDIRNEGCKSKKYGNRKQQKKQTI